MAKHDPMEIPFRGTFDRDTLYRAVLLASRPTPTQRAIRIVFAILFLALLGFTAVEIAGMVLQGQVDGARVLRGVLSLAVLGYVAARPLLLPRQVTDSMWKDPDMRREQRGFVNASGVTYVSETARTELPWDKYSRLHLAPGLASLVTSDGRLTALPRSFFASDADWQHFTRLASDLVKIYA